MRAAGQRAGQKAGHAPYAQLTDEEAGGRSPRRGPVAGEEGFDLLLLDLGLPRSDSLALLGLESTFNFGDALRHLRRLDTTLINSAFTTALDGLRILAYATGDEPLKLTSAAELFMLLSALRQHFQHIVVNITGQPDSEALRTFVSHCDKLLWCTDQNVLDCCRNLAILNLWREKGMKLDHARLLIDRYLKGAAPDAEALEKSFGLDVIAVLPMSPEVRLNAKNQGQTLFALAPREPLTQGLKTLGERLAKRSEGLEKSSTRWFERLLRTGK